MKKTNYNLGPCSHDISYSPLSETYTKRSIWHFDYYTNIKYDQFHRIITQGINTRADKRYTSLTVNRSPFSVTKIYAF